MRNILRCDEMEYPLMVWFSGVLGLDLVSCSVI